MYVCIYRTTGLEYNWTENENNFFVIRRNLSTYNYTLNIGGKQKKPRKIKQFPEVKIKIK